MIRILKDILEIAGKISFAAFFTSFFLDWIYSLEISDINIVLARCVAFALFVFLFNFCEVTIK